MKKARLPPKGTGPVCRAFGEEGCAGLGNRIGGGIYHFPSVGSMVPLALDRDQRGGKRE